MTHAVFKSGAVAVSLASRTTQALARAGQWIATGWRAFLRALDEPHPDEADLLDRLSDREERVFDIQPRRRQGPPR